jgi:phosphatidylinositol alpha-1,6-mannosyltransferase
MKILIISYDYKPQVGGIAEYVDQVATQLNNNRLEVTIISQSFVGSKLFDKKKEYDIHRITFSNKIQRYLRGTVKFLYLHSQKKFDYVIIGNLYSDPEIFSILSRLLRIRVGIIVYGMEFNINANILTKLKRWISLKMVNNVFYISEFTGKIIRNMGVSKNKMFLAHPGISKSFIKKALEDSKNYKRRSTQPTLLTLSRLIERKGIDNTIRAVDIVRKTIPKIRYIIAGTGPYKRYLKRLVHDLDLENHVEFTGYVPEIMKEKYFLESDLFIMPSRELKNGDVEGFGIVFLEANVYKIPVIGGHSGGVPDAVKHNINGLLVDPDSITEIAGSIILLLQDQNLASTLGKQGYKRVLDKFLWEKTVRSFVKVIK